MDERSGWIYVLYSTDEPDHVRYLGISVDPRARFRQHKSNARRGKEGAVYSWMRKHGLDTIRMSIETKVPVEYDSLLQYEREQIAAYRALGHDLMNRTDGGDGVLGLRHTEETRRKMSEAKRGSKNSQWGVVSPETSLRNQRLKTGVPGYWSGRTRSEETLRKMSEANRGKRVETKINEDIVREMRSLFEQGVMQKEIAERFGVSSQLVCNVIKRRRWGWVE